MDEIDFLEKSSSHFDELLLAEPKACLEKEIPALISLPEFITEQAKDRKCQEMFLRMEWDEGFPFGHDDYGILRRKTKIDSRIVISRCLRQRILFLAHHTPIGGHPEGRKLYNTLRKYYYWPYLAINCYSTSRNCVECAKERLRLRKRVTGIKLFPATAPLEDIAMELPGPFLKTPRGDIHLLANVDRYSKLVRTVLLERVTYFKIAKAFTTHWVFTNEAPNMLLTNNRKQFNSRLMLQTNRIPSTKELFTTMYHLQTNEQTERMNRTLCEALRKFVSERPKDWELYTGIITYSYYILCHESTGMPPFELVLSCPPGEWHIQIATDRSRNLSLFGKLSVGGFIDYEKTWTEPRGN